jgi:hypothetical protein
MTLVRTSSIRGPLPHGALLEAYATFQVPPESSLVGARVCPLVSKGGHRDARAPLSISFQQACIVVDSP